MKININDFFFLRANMNYVILFEKNNKQLGNCMDNVKIETK